MNVRMSLEDLATANGVSPRTMRRTLDAGIAAGKITVYRPGPRSPRYNPIEVDRFISWRAGGAA